jgi:hypothetical protein
VIDRFVPEEEVGRELSDFGAVSRNPAEGSTWDRRYDFWNIFATKIGVFVQYTACFFAKFVL